MTSGTALGLVLDKLEGVKPSSSGYTARCPGHEDRQNSLSVSAGEDGRVLLKCFSGCETAHVVAALGLEMRDLFEPGSEAVRQNGHGRMVKGHEGVSTPSRDTATLQHSGVTLAQYAESKQLDARRLRAFGLSDFAYLGNPAVRIPYFDEDSNEGPVRFRVRLEKSPDGDRFTWRKGSKLCLYGLNRLDLAHVRGYVALVEGESDCHTLWSHGEPAIGIPGANSWNEARDAPALAGIPVIYVVDESDRGGEALLAKLATSALVDRVRVVNLAPFKDPSALHCDAPEHFLEGWRAAMQGAQPLADSLDAASRAEAEAVWEACADLARDPDILARVAETVAALGVTGEREAVRLVYLAVVSRLLPRPVSVAVKGPSSAGKSYTVEQTLRLFPEEAYFALTAMSERALAYSDEPLKHRMLVLYEAAGQTGDMGSYLMRSLLSEGCIRYETVEKTKYGMRARLIERPGPTGLIVTTTATRLHPENETRMVSLTIADTKEQTRAVFRALAQGRPTEPDFVPWHALQRWLALGERRVVVPFAHALAELIPPAAVRLRRDFGLLLTLIQTHALLHRATRGVDASGAVAASLDDYEAARALVEPLIAAGVEATVPETIRETVAAVRSLCPGPDDTASISAIAKALKLDKSATSRRVSAARERGYLVNHETKRGQPAKIGNGEPLPANTPVLPDRCTVAAFLERDSSPPPSSGEADLTNDPGEHAPAETPGRKVARL